MTLFSLALRNIRRRFYDYFLYFLSMVFSIMIYFTFVSIKFNEQVLNLGPSLAEKVKASFTASSVVLAIFALIFIWYSNSFFTRKRKKEIGLYSLLGVKKRQIGRMLFYENILMGLIALVVGIFLGSLLSKLFVMLLVRLMGYSVPIAFTIIPEAIFSTFQVFAILFLITSIHGYTIIYRFKLVDLFKAESTVDKIPRASIIKALLSVLLIGGGYWFYLNVKTEFLRLLLITLISVVSGTFLMFSSLTVFMIKLARKRKKNYFKGINMIGTSNLLFRIKGHARTLAIIAVLSATTLTAISVTASLYYDFKTELDIVAPFSYVFMTDDSSTFKILDKNITNIIDKSQLHQIKDKTGFKILSVKASIPSGYNGEYRTGKVFVMSESEYNELAEKRGLKEVQIGARNETYFIDEYYTEVFRESYTDKIIKVQTDSGPANYKVIGFQARPILNIGLLRRTLIVKDEVYRKLQANHTIVRGKAYNITNQRKSLELTEDINGLLKESRPQGKDIDIWFSSFYKYYQNGITSTGQGIFIGAFLGLVFLISTGSIIFFKQLSEANEEKLRYRILRNIGVTGKEIKSLVARQVFIIFALPLIVGVIHSLVAVSILEKFLAVNLMVPIGITIGAYTLIYMVYYMLTVNGYFKIVATK